uniref:Ankyrin repeat and LEM domain containing 1 n=1 Tax=Podarcis muralis TaxID=64176 RepID=A0A670K0H2_PODMU
RSGCARLCRAETLLQQGADPNLVLPEGIAGIHLAAGMEQESGIRCLALILRYGGDPNIRSVDGLTPLHVAAAWGCYMCLNLLLMEGGDPHLKDQVGQRVLAIVGDGAGGGETGLQGLPAAVELRHSSFVPLFLFYTGYRREESFLTTVTEDTLNPGRSLRLYDACPILSGGSLRPPPDESLQHAKPPTFLSRPPKSQDKTSSFEDRIASSFLTECSLASSTLSDQGDLCAQPAASSGLGGVLGQPAPSPLATRGFHIGGPEPLKPDLVFPCYMSCAPLHHVLTNFSVLVAVGLSVLHSPPGYSPELSSALDTYQIPDGQEDEMALSRPFDQPDKSRKWREGLLKSSFNYLLLDPRVTQNLPFRSQYISRAECFRTFISAIFYVGKGKRSRPYCHLYEALTHYQQSRRKQGRQACSKVQHILEIWASGQGVISMHCFQNVIPVEAYTREACMVDAIGLKMLTNQKKGNYYGIVAGWPMRRRRCLGTHLLHRAMQIFLAEGERQLRPADIRTGQ